MNEILHFQKCNGTCLSELASEVVNFSHPIMESSDADYLEITNQSSADHRCGLNSEQSSGNYQGTCGLAHC